MLALVAFLSLLLAFMMLEMAARRSKYWVGGIFGLGVTISAVGAIANDGKLVVLGMIIVLLGLAPIVAKVIEYARE